MPNVYIKTLTSSFKSREHSQEKDTLLPYLKPRPPKLHQWPWNYLVTKAREKHTVFLDLIRQSIHWKISIERFQMIKIFI